MSRMTAGSTLYIRSVYVYRKSHSRGTGNQQD